MFFFVLKESQLSGSQLLDAGRVKFGNNGKQRRSLFFQPFGEDPSVAEFPRLLVAEKDDVFSAGAFRDIREGKKDGKRFAFQLLPVELMIARVVKITLLMIASGNTAAF